MKKTIHRQSSKKTKNKRKKNQIKIQLATSKVCARLPWTSLYLFNRLEAELRMLSCFRRFCTQIYGRCFKPQSRTWVFRRIHNSRSVLPKPTASTELTILPRATTFFGFQTVLVSQGTIFHVLCRDWGELTISARISEFPCSSETFGCVSEYELCF